MELRDQNALRIGVEVKSLRLDAEMKGFGRLDLDLLDKFEL